MNLKKLSSLLLALVMLFTMIPTAAFAEGEPAPFSGVIEQYNSTDGSAANTSDTGTLAMDGAGLYPSNYYIRLKNADDSYVRLNNEMIQMSNASASIEQDDTWLGIRFSGNNGSVSVSVGSEVAVITGPTNATSGGIYYEQIEYYNTMEETTPAGTTKWGFLDMASCQLNGEYYIRIKDSDNNYITFDLSKINTQSAEVDLAGDNSWLKVKFMAPFSKIEVKVGEEEKYATFTGPTSGGQGGSGSNFVVKFSADEVNWMDYTTGSPAIQINKGDALFFQLYVNGSEAIFDVSDSAGLLNFAAPGSTPAKTYRVTVKDSVSASGMAQVTATVGSSTYGTISVRVVVPQPPVVSDYANAVVKEVTPNSGKVSFGSVSGDASDVDIGFSVESGELFFDTTDKTAGSYDAVVGGKLYTAVIFNAVDEGYTARTPVAPDANEPPASAFSKSEGINILYYQNMGGTQWTTFNENSSSTQAISWIYGDQAPRSFYVYNVKNGALVDMELNSALLVHGADSDFERTEITVDGKRVYKFTAKYTDENENYKYGRLGTIGDTVVCIRDGIRAAEFSLMVNFNDFGSSRVNVGLSHTEQDVANNTTMAVQEMPSVGMGIGQDLGVSTFYLVRSTGEPAVLDYLIYDEVDISTLHVKSSNPDFVAVDDFLVTAKDGKNAIGFNLKLKDKSQVNRAELEISFKKKGEDTLNTWYMLVYMTPTAEPTGETVEVKSEAEFKEKYATMVSGTIVLTNEGANNGVYAMDITHTSSTVGFVGKDGQEIVIVGEDGKTGPIITIKTGGIPAKWGDFIVDGDGDPAAGGSANTRAVRRDGVYCASGNLLMGNMLIRDCNVGFSRNSTGNTASTRVFGTEIENCTIGFTIDANGTYLQDARIEGCDIGILHKYINLTPMGFTPPTSSYIKNNTLVDNTVDVKLETSQAINFTQNYFGHSGVGTAPRFELGSGITNNSYYAPYYTNEQKTTLKADLDGAATENGIFQLPVDLTGYDDEMNLVEGNTATTFTTDIFEEMKSEGGLAASIPVTEAVLNEDTQRMMPVVTTIWGFESSTIDDTQAAETMDLRVTDELSPEAKAIVDAEVESGAVQYVNFQHDGDLPGTATVKVLKTNDTDLTTLKLYYINEETGKVEEADIVSVVDDGTYYIITVTHCSEYIISGGLVIKEETTDDGNQSGGNSGDGNTTGGSGSSAGSATGTGTSASSGKPASSKPTSSANDFVSAEEVQQKLESSSDDEVEIDVSDKKLLTSKAFGLLADAEGKTMVLEGDGYSWSFDSEDITDENAIKASNLDTSIGTDSPKEKAIDEALGGAEHTTVHFAYNGNLPGEADITVDVGAENAGVKQLYLYNADGTFTYCGEVTVDEKGILAFSTAVAGDFVLLDEKLPEAPEAETPEVEEPLPEAPAQEPEPQKAGLPVWTLVAGAGGLSIIAAIVAFIISKRRG